MAGFVPVFFGWTDRAGLVLTTLVLTSLLNTNLAMVKSNKYKTLFETWTYTLQVCSNNNLTIGKSNMYKNNVRNLDLVTLQVRSYANLKMVKSNISTRCVKNLDLTPFKFVQVLPTTRTNLEKAGFEFED